MLEAIIFQNGQLQVLDQLELPHTTVYREITSAEDAHDAIRRMVVRGAPAIAMVGVAGVAVDALKHSKANPSADLEKYIAEKLDYVKTARPTAVNLGAACEEMKQRRFTTSEALIAAAEEMLVADVATNKQIGARGLEFVREQVGNTKKISVITLCNTGSLATAGYGTALGIVRALHAANQLERLYVMETRPYLQGARLTAYEAAAEGIPATLIADSMAASVLASDKNVRLAVVGADRVAANRDTANKIGTLQLAIVANHFNVPFVVAAPTTSIDLATKDGSGIRIEERPASELTDINGKRIAAEGVDVWNPSFDVTPSSLITKVITEKEAY